MGRSSPETSALFEKKREWGECLPGQRPPDQQASHQGLRVHSEDRWGNISAAYMAEIGRERRSNE